MGRREKNFTVVSGKVHNITKKKPKAIIRIKIYQHLIQTRLEGQSQATFTIEISSKEENREIQTWNKLNRIPVTTTANTFLDTCKRLLSI